MNYGKKIKISSERALLDESRINGRLINAKSNGFLLEAEGGMSYIEKCKRNPDLPLWLTGVIQSGDKPNRNGRIYPWEYLKRECIRYMENEVRNGLSYGELDHPESSATPSLNNAALVIEDLSFKGKDVIAKIKVLSAYMPDNAPGRKVRGFILNNKNVGISSRALGSLEQYSESEYDIVAEDMEMVCWDFVGNASNFGSEKMQLVEANGSTPLLHKKSKLLFESEVPKIQTLTESEKVYLEILGLERFLKTKNILS